METMPIIDLITTSQSFFLGLSRSFFHPFSLSPTCVEPSVLLFPPPPPSDLRHGDVQSVRLRSLPLDMSAKGDRRAKVLQGRVDPERTTCNAYVVFASADSVSGALSANMTEVCIRQTGGRGREHIQGTWDMYGCYLC